MGKIVKKLLVKSLSFLLISFSLNANSAPENYELMLIGSDFKFCRSSATHFCDSSEITSLSAENTRTAPQYKLASSQIKKMFNVDLWKPSRQALRYDLQLLFNEIIKRAGTDTLSYSQLIHIWKSATIKRDGKRLSGHSLFLSMVENELAIILDHLEFEQVDYAGRRFKEKVSLIKSQQSSTVSFAKKIVSLSQAQNSQSQILISTAGSRDSFVDVDSYIDLFSQVGIKASWLPIDAAMNHLLVDKKSCDELEIYRAKVLNSYDRKRLYEDLIQIQMNYCKDPSLMTKAIDAADTLIIIGDKPKLLNRTFMVNNVDTKILQQLKTKIKAKKLTVVTIGNMTKGIVAKGNNGAVILQGDSQSAMLNGASTAQQIEDACDNYGACESDYHSVIYQTGGIGLIDFPIIDTEVSSSGNIARLARVGLDSKLYSGMSIDEDTALLISNNASKNHIKVIGQQGLILLEQSHGAVDLMNMKYSYFTPGDEVILHKEKKVVNYPDWKKTPGKSETQLARYKNLFYSDSFKRFSEQACVISERKWADNAGRNQQFRVELEVNEHDNLHIGALKIQDGYQLYCSINDMSLNINRN